MILNQVFTTLAAADSFFDDTLLDLGAYLLNTIVDLEFDLFFTGSRPGQGFGFDYLLGANSALILPPPDGGGTVPEPGTIYLLALALLLLTSTRLARSRVVGAVIGRSAR